MSRKCPEDEKSILSFTLPKKLYDELSQKIGKGKIGDFLRQAAEKKLKEQEMFLIKAYQILEESSEYKSYDKRIIEAASILVCSWEEKNRDEINISIKKKPIIRGGIYPVTYPTDDGKRKEIYQCVVVSNNVQNEISQYVIVMPITFIDFPLVPFHVSILLKGNKPAKIVAERIHLVDKLWLGNCTDEIEPEIIVEIRKSLLLTLESHIS